MNNASLLLHPRLADQPPPTPEELQDFLHEQQLVEGRADYDPRILLLAEGFLRQITFMGCSPHIRLEAESPDDRGFCHLTLEGPFDEPRLRHGSNTRPPICPHCRKRIAQWQPALQGQPLHCPHCDQQVAVGELGWKHTAGFARIFIEIHNIFPGEAVPVDGLLTSLGRRFGGEWVYCYWLP